MGISQIRGAILEEVVLFLLEKVGYRIVNAGEDGTRGGHAGLEVRGRGEWHQIDSLAAYDHSPAFMYPLRLLVEAKCYARNRTIGIEVARNSLGVITDIAQNYFSLNTPGDGEIQLQRFNYHGAIFSTSGFSANAVRYAIAHQIFPIQYKDVPLMEPVADLILQLADEHFYVAGAEKVKITRIREKVRDVIREPNVGNEFVFSGDGFLIIQQIRDRINSIRGSYFGMLQGRWPLHLLSEQPLPPSAFQTDKLACRVRVNHDGVCKFEPSEFEHQSAEWFSLQFSLPQEIVNLLTQHDWNPIDIAHVKMEYFSTVSLSGIIGGVRRQVRLELDQDLLNAYLQRL
jgi:hypothetical protein